MLWFHYPVGRCIKGNNKSWRTHRWATVEQVKCDGRSQESYTREKGTDARDSPPGRICRIWQPLGGASWWKWNQPSMGYVSSSSIAEEREAGSFEDFARNGWEGQNSQFDFWGTSRIVRCYLLWNFHGESTWQTPGKYPLNWKELFFPRVGFLMGAFFSGWSCMRELRQPRNAGIWGACSHI